VPPADGDLSPRLRRGVVDDLAAAIQTRIVTGEIAPGTRLRQEQLAAEYELSRTPIREALRKLQAEGTVELVPNQGAVVRGPTVRDVREGYEVRAELEGMAAALAATWITDEHLGELREAEELFRRAIEAGPPGPVDGPHEDAWVRANDQFHEAVQAAAGNERLRRTIRDLHKTFPRSLTWGALQADSRLMAENVEQHHAVLAAIERRDADAARAAMRGHVLRAGELIARWVERR
jgi:DNA-binding GntR family transcriptional regulator